MKKKDSPIYLDYSATTPIDPEVLTVIQNRMLESFGNASSVHSFGRTAKVVLEESRETIAITIGAEPSEIFFTSGGTESDNQALIGSALLGRRERGADRLLLSPVEHHAVLDCAEYLCELGFVVDWMNVDREGIIDVDDAASKISEKTAVVSAMHVNNETGVIQPIAALAETVHRHGIAFHSDTVQSYGKIPVRVNDLGADLIALSAHKINGPKGIGSLYIKRGTNLDALIHGGSQERNMRAGTENIPLIAGFAKAAENAELHREQLFTSAERWKNLMKEKISSSLDGIIFNGDGATAVPHIVSVSLDSNVYNVEGESLLLNMDLHGVAVSSGSACTSGSVQPSHVLLAMGRDAKTTQATVRFSFGKFTTNDEVTKAAETFCSIVRSLPKK